MPGPVTLADIARSGVLLLVWCRCGHRAELAGDAIPLPRSAPIPGIENRLRCTACGAKNTASITRCIGEGAVSRFCPPDSALPEWWAADHPVANPSSPHRLQRGHCKRTPGIGCGLQP